MPVYCGNNRLNKRVRSGKLHIGTRYECLRQGVGLGLRLPINPDYTDKYLPIDERRMYCGTKHMLPTGYDVMGNLPQCHSKGVGIGMRKKAQSRKNSRRPIKRKNKKKKSKGQIKRRKSRKNSRKTKRKQSKRKQSKRKQSKRKLKKKSKKKIKRNSKRKQSRKKSRRKNRRKSRR
jgi:hypothetical protein